jgi:hypothetical protein
MQNLPAAGNALLAPFDPTPEGVSRDPIFAVQHTRFPCGGVALGVRIHHTVCDGDGFFQVVRDLAELYRGILSSETGEDTVSDVFLAYPPHIRPYMSERLAPEERLAALDFKTSLLHVDPPASIDSAADASVSSVTIFPPPPFPVVGRFLRFSSRELASLKEQATNPNGNAWISTFEALSAHIYQRVHKARLQLYAKDPGLGELSLTDFLTPINLRSRLGLPPRYFPNGLLTSNGIIPPDILATGQLWQVASAVHDLTRSKSLTSKDELHHTLKWIVAQSDMRQIDDNFRYGSGSFMVSQWNKFDMYAGSVFDVGPVLVSPPFTQSSLVDGLVYFLLTEELATGGDAGAIDVSLSLIKPVWDIMDQDETLLQ